jgi:hypothetical protein
VDEEARFNPIFGKVFIFKKMENGKGVKDPIVTTPVIAIIPTEDFFS